MTMPRDAEQLCQWLGDADVDFFTIPQALCEFCSLRAAWLLFPPSCIKIQRTQQVVSIAIVFHSLRDVPISKGMAEQAETAFARTFLNTLSTQPIIYADDYQQPLEQSLKRIPVLPVLYPPILFNLRLHHSFVH